jgi:hypothetical protein
MAKCDEGYLCGVCGEDVASLIESDLYLRFVIGMVDPELLHTLAERHVRCNPALAQFIVHEDFEPVLVEGDFDKRTLDPTLTRQREALVTRGWLRLREIMSWGHEAPITDYLLPEAAAKWRGK